MSIRQSQEPEETVPQKRFGQTIIKHRNAGEPAPIWLSIHLLEQDWGMMNFSETIHSHSANFIHCRSHTKKQRSPGKVFIQRIPVRPMWGRYLDNFRFDGSSFHWKAWSGEEAWSENAGHSRETSPLTCIWEAVPFPPAVASMQRSRRTAHVLNVGVQWSKVFAAVDAYGINLRASQTSVVFSHTLEKIRFAFFQLYIVLLPEVKLRVDPK